VQTNPILQVCSVATYAAQMKTHFNFSKAIDGQIKVFLDEHCNVANAPTSPKQWQMQWIYSETDAN
jgi:hypothetical protein